MPSPHRLNKLRLALEAELLSASLMLISTDLASKKAEMCKCVVAYQGNVGEFDAKKINGRWRVGKQTDQGFISLIQIEQPEWLYRFDNPDLITPEQWCQLENQYSA